MDYQVTRQNGFYDEELRIEIATGKDEVSPGMLVPNYDEEGEYDTATEAVEAAIKLATEHYPEETRPEVTVSSAASIGMYPTSEDGWDYEELRKWARSHDEAKTELTEGEDDWYFGEEEAMAEDRLGRHEN